MLFIQQYVADNEGSKSNRVRDMTFRLGLEIGLWKVEDKKAVNYKIVQMARSYKKIEKKEKNIGYNIKALQQTACLVVNPITVGNFAFLFNCTPVGQTSDSMTVPT